MQTFILVIIRETPALSYPYRTMKQWNGVDPQIQPQPQITELCSFVCQDFLMGFYMKIAEEQKTEREGMSQ